MRECLILLMSFISLAVSAAIPTEEGLLKNLNNSAAQVGQTIIRFKVTTSDESKGDTYYRVTLSNENPNAVQILQQKYSGAQMSAVQLKDVKYEADLFARVKRDMVNERTVFYSTLGFLIFNKGIGLESVIEKTGGSVLKTRAQYNDDKMRLLRQYKGYLANSKSKGDADSPLNPQEPKEKQRVQELFRSNSLRPSPNVKLAKMGASFMWHADWKNVHGYFTNEERRLRILEIVSSDSPLKLELDQYGILNGINEFPKSMAIQTKEGLIYKIQVLGVESKSVKEKPILTKYDELRKIMETNPNKEETEVFLF